LNKERKKLDAISDAVEKIPHIVTRLDSIDRYLTKVATHEHVELTVLRKLHGREQ